MSGFGDKADHWNELKCPLLTQSGHNAERKNPSVHRPSSGVAVVRSESACRIETAPAQAHIQGGGYDMKRPTHPTPPNPAELERYKRELALWYATVWDEWGAEPWVAEKRQTGVSNDQDVETTHD